MNKRVCWPTLRQWKKTLSVLNKKEKIVFAVFVSLISLSLFYIIFVKPSSSDIPTPTEGGTYVEGMIGQPRYINPILSDNSKVDKDISNLIFSGLVKFNEDGEIVCDATESFTISEDKKTYTIKMRDGMFWHDGNPFNTSDLEFTFKLITDSTYNSPLYENFKSVELFVDDNLTARFILKQPYAPFLENLTFKILPKHVWENVPSNGFTLASANLQPIGSGPFQFNQLKKNSDGLVRLMSLKRFDNFYGEEVFLKNIEFYFYPNEEELLSAYQKKEILAIGQLPDNYQTYLPDLSKTNLYKIYLPQFFSVFINQKNNKILEDKNIRIALATAINRDLIIQKALNSKASPVDQIIIPASISIADQSAVKNSVHGFDRNLASDVLEQLGWIDSDADGIRDKEELKLEFTLVTSNQEWLINTAEEIKEQWKAIGVSVVIDANLQGDTIKSRGYDLLLFGQSPIASSDPCAFWHSSQQEYPGINLSLFANSTADTILENIRTTFNKNDSFGLFKDLQEILTNEVPSIPLLQPFEFFAVNQKIGGIDVEDNGYPSSRFSTINKWYIQTKYAKRNQNFSSAN